MRPLSSDTPLTDCYQDVPLPDRPSVDGLLDLLRTVLLTPYVQNIQIPIKGPIQVHWLGEPGARIDFDPDDIDPMKAIRSVFLESCEDDAPLLQLLSTAVLKIEQKSLVVAFSVISHSSGIPHLLGHDKSVSGPMTRLLGGKVLRSSELADDVVVLLGAKDTACVLKTVEAGMKVSVP